MIKTTIGFLTKITNLTSQLFVWPLWPSVAPPSCWWWWISYPESVTITSPLSSCSWLLWSYHFLPAFITSWLCDNGSYNCDCNILYHFLNILFRDFYPSFEFYGKLDHIFCAVHTVQQFELHHHNLYVSRAITFCVSAVIRTADVNISTVLIQNQRWQNLG